MKKILKVFLLSMFIFTLMASSVYASTSNASSKNNTVQPNIVGDCPLYGTHQASSTGRVYVVYVDGVMQPTTFSEYQCPCGAHVIFDGYPTAHPAGPVGHYAFDYTYSYIGGYAAANVSSSNYHYTSNTSLPQWYLIAP